MNIYNTDRMKLQYFSKLYKKWMDFKSTDCLESLLKYKYKIRINPKYVIGGKV